jgi:tetratricopeptide (TPR) repeat protein
LGEPVTRDPHATAGMSLEAVNADLKTARAANAEKRFADAEALMLKDTAAKPDLPYPWIELGLAEMGMKKYTDAEASFKAALGSGTGPVVNKAASAGFYTPDGTSTHSSQSLAVPDSGPKKRDPNAEGVSLSSLGEVYIRTNKPSEAKEAFDKAAKANPPQAAFYYRNEAILFLGAGDAADQVEAADKAIGLDPTRAALYFFKGQGLAAQATIDSATQKLILPAGCADALQKYLDLEPTGQYATDAKGMLTAAGVAIKPARK